MKRTATLFAAACLVAGTAAAQAPSRTAYTPLKDVVWARDIGAATITVDGNINEAEWAQADMLRLSQDGTQPVFLPGGGTGGRRPTFAGQPAPDPGQAIVKYLRKGNMLYISADVNDKSIGGRRDFFEADGLVIAMIDRTRLETAFAMGTPTGSNFFAPAFGEIIYNWANVGSTAIPAGQDTVGVMPTLKGSLTTPASMIVAAATVMKPNSVSNDDRNRTAAFTDDQGYTMEISVDLSKMGYDFARSGGDKVGFTVAFYDRDYNWPVTQTKPDGSPKLYQGLAWFQGIFANASNDGMAFIYGNPAVTTTSGALPATTGGDVTVPAVTAGSRLTVDGRLDESAWSVTQPQVTLKYQASLDMLKALPSPQGPYRTSWFRPGGGATATPVIDASTGRFTLIHRGNTLYIGLDSDDQAISGVTRNVDRYDGFRLNIRDATPVPAAGPPPAPQGDNYIPGSRIPSRQFTAVIDSMGAVRFLQDAATEPYRSAITGAAFLKQGGTAGNSNDIDTGYQMEVAINLEALGLAETNRLIWIGIAYFDGDDLQDAASSYGTRTWWLAEGGDGPVARTYLDPNTQVGTAGEGTAEGAGTFRALGGAPNPVSGATALRYELAEAGDVTVEVFDVLGRKVGLMTPGVQTAGLQQVEFDASALSPGAYVYRVRMASGATATGRILVAR